MFCPEILINYRHIKVISLNSYTNSMTTSTFTLKDVLDAARRFKEQFPPLEEYRYFTNPVNLPKIREAVESRPATYFPSTIKVTPNDWIPDNLVTQKWHPPASGQFTELEVSDEAWARPLGLGSVEQIDKGPLILKIAERTLEALNVRVLETVIEPTPCSFYSQYDFEPLPISGMVHNSF